MTWPWVRCTWDRRIGSQASNAPPSSRIESKLRPASTWFRTMLTCRSTRPFAVVPGAQAQVDWGDEGDLLAHVGIPHVYSFHLVLAHSRDAVASGHGQPVHRRYMPPRQTSHQLGGRLRSTAVPKIRASGARWTMELALSWSGVIEEGRWPRSSTPATYVCVCGDVTTLPRTTAITPPLGPLEMLPGDPPGYPPDSRSPSALDPQRRDRVLRKAVVNHRAVIQH